MYEISIMFCTKIKALSICAKRTADSSTEWKVEESYKIYYYTHSPLIISDPVSYHLTPIHVVGLSQLITEWSFNAKQKNFI